MKFYLLIAILSINGCNNKDHSADSKSDPIFQEVKKIDDEIMKDVGVLAMAIDIKGSIIAAKSFSEFPYIAQQIINLKLTSSSNQLLVVDVGETALLVTTKSNYTTTGYFSMKTFKLMDTETNMGKIPVLMEFTTYDDLLLKFKNNEEKIRKLGVQYIQKEIAKNREKAEQIKQDTKSILAVEDIASLLSYQKLGEMIDGSDILYRFHHVATLCHIKESIPGHVEWMKEFDKIKKSFGGNENLYSSIWCANSPLKKKDHVLSFEECMCSNHYSEDFHVRKYAGSAEYEQIKSYLKKTRDIASERTK